MIEDLVNSFKESLYDAEKREQNARIIVYSLTILPEDQAEELKTSLVEGALKLIESGEVDIYTEIWIYSFLIQIYKDKNLVRKFISRVKENEGMSWQQKIFVYWQIHHYLFVTPEATDEDTLIYNWRLMEEAFRITKKSFGLPAVKIEGKDLNDDYAVVIIEQFLAVQHGPTKTVLDRCAVLQKELNKKVILINTAECMSVTGVVPYYDYCVGGYNESFLNDETVEWKGETISFYQCNRNMPDFLELRQLLNMILNIKPSIVVLVGGPSVLASLVNEYIPVFSVGLTQSGIVPSMASFMAVEERLLDKCGSIVEKMGRDKNCLIPGRFTFSLKPQTESHTREEFGIKEDEYVIAVIGTRLDEEITDSFMEMFEHIVFDKMRILIMGHCTRMDEILRKHPSVSDYIQYLGQCNDILSMLELCDIYVNPHRSGGATSAVEAMFKGKPVLTTDFGDVRGVVDEEFSYTSYEEMEKAIIDLYSNKDLYEKQSEHAKKLAEIDMDSPTEFKKMLKVYDERKLSKIGG